MALPLDAPEAYNAEHADRIAWLNANRGAFSVYVIDVDPGKVRIDGLPYDEYIHVLEGRLILTPDDGKEVEYKKGDSLILPEGYTGYWYMPDQRSIVNLSLSTPFLSYLTKTQLAVSYVSSSSPNNSLDTAVLTGHAITVINVFYLVRSVACRF